MVYFLADVNLKFSNNESSLLTDQENKDTGLPEDYYFNMFLEDSSLYLIKYDTLKIIGKSYEGLIFDNEWDKKLSIRELKKLLEDNSYKWNQDLCIWNEDAVFDAIYSYNKLKSISYPLIKKIIPQTERLPQLVIRENQVFRKIEKIYSTNSLSGHIQLIVLGYGEVFPTIQLITLEKNNLEYIDKVVVYSMSIKDKKTVRIKGCLNEKFDTLRIKEIHSSYTQNRYLHDTIEYSYEILTSGKIEGC